VLRAQDVLVRPAAITLLLFAWCWGGGPVRAVPQRAAASTDAEAEALYSKREDLPSALAAAEFWAQRVAGNPADFQSAWKLARACYWLGGHVPAAERRARFEQGIAAGRAAAAARPDRPEGHFWTAANMGGMAEGFGVRAGLRYRGAIKASLEKALAIDPAYLEGSADRALGRWYARVPRLFGGSDAKAVEHLQQSLKHAPDSIPSRFFLAEVYLEMNRRGDARRELEMVIAAPFTPDWMPEEREFKKQAEAHLQRLR
jgi:tetratricopeptide (TPR) repeat protein